MNIQDAQSYFGDILINILMMMRNMSKTSSLLSIPPSRTSSPTFRCGLAVIYGCDLCSRMETPLRQILKSVMRVGG